jgi:REP element-mobilizing transposase RayT
MARPLRIEFPGAVYHITSRGNERKAIFKDDQDRKMFLNALEHVTHWDNGFCHAYCLMDTTISSLIPPMEIFP